MHKVTQYFYLSIIPLIIFMIGIVFMQSMFPIYINSGIGYGPDAAYVYLLAAVDMLQGYPPVFTDHPGTPLQVIIAMVIPVIWLTSRVLDSSALGMIDAVLHNPERYLFCVSVLLLFLTVCASYYLGLKLYRATADFRISIACQCSPLVFALVSPLMVYPTAESLLQSLSIVLIAVLIPLFYRSPSDESLKLERIALVAGVLCGIGVATKLTFLPMLGLLFILPTYRLMFYSFLGCALAYLLGIAPIISKLPFMFDWFVRMATHSELHGLGSRSIFNLVQYRQNILRLYDTFPFFYQTFAAIFVFLAIAVARQLTFNQKLNTNFLRGSIVVLGVAVAHTIVVAKHPGISYMVPVLPLALFALCWGLRMALQSSDSLIFSKINDAVWLVLLVIVIYIATMSAFNANTALKTLRKSAESSYNAITTEIQKYERPTLIGTFNCSFQGCATWFGIALTRGLDLKLNQVNPSFYYYDIFSKNLRIPGEVELPNTHTAATIKQLIDAGQMLFLISPVYPVGRSNSSISGQVKLPHLNGL